MKDVNKIFAKSFALYQRRYKRFASYQRRYALILVLRKLLKWRKNGR